MRHLIQKQQFLLTIPARMDAFRAQHAASRYLREQLLPALERIFDELCGPDEFIRLDYCFIDLGMIGEGFLNNGGIDEAVYRLLKAGIREVIERELAKRPGIRTGVRESIVEQWWYYMEHGRLPWNADELTEESYRQVLEVFSADFLAISELRKAIKEKSGSFHTSSCSAFLV